MDSSGGFYMVLYDCTTDVQTKAFHDILGVLFVVCCLLFVVCLLVGASLQINN